MPSVRSVTVRSLSLTGLIDPAALPRDVLPPPGQPAGDLIWLLMLGGRGQGIPVRLNGKNYRRLLRDVDDAKAPVEAVFQASLQAVPETPGVALVNAGFRLRPDGQAKAVGPHRPAVQSSGPGTPAIVSLPWLEASLSVGAAELGDAETVVLRMEGLKEEIPVRFAGPVALPEGGGAFVLTGKLTGTGSTLELQEAKLEVKPGGSTPVSESLPPAEPEPKVPEVSQAVVRPEPEPSTKADPPAPKAEAAPGVEPAPASVGEPVAKAEARAGKARRRTSKTAGALVEPAPKVAKPAGKRTRRKRATPQRLSGSKERQRREVLDCEDIVRGVVSREVRRLAGPFLEELKTSIALAKRARGRR